MYIAFIKRTLDIFLSAMALLILSPILLILSLVGVIAMGGNPFFVQPRPGKIGKNGKERIFKLIKFRTMNNKCDKEGRLLPDEKRLTRYGKALRSTSLDELPELINILKGDMSIVGPRPLLVRDVIFMSETHRRRHTVRPGLTGLAQINGRNNISWEEKLDYDIEYINNHLSFMGDIKIVLKTVICVFKRSDVVRENTASDIDYGDWLHIEGMVTKEEYDIKQEKAKKMLQVGSMQEEREAVAK